MSIHYYGPGELSSGFVGFRVSVAFDNKHRQSWFSTKDAKVQDESDFEYKRAHLKAQIREAELSAESALHQYQTYVTTNHPNLAPERGVGVHGLSLQIRRNNGRANSSAPRFEPGFLVNHKVDGKGYNRLFTFFSQSYSDAWRDAVLFWGERHEILQEDIDRLLANPPAPERFKELRRFLNEQSGNELADLIPVEALEPVFREQRAELASRRAAQKYRLGQSDKDATETEIALWFEKESTQQAG
ncbi:hypothetical protein [Marinobacter sp.]|uniref:hypothetical protein n=1 Tax=Marinobacter sp. TaxID=50741 RepID=UPI00356ACC14